MRLERRLDREVRERAKFRCEYCLVPQSPFRFRFPIDHIVARQHAGVTATENLCLCCGFCNLHKGPNLSGIDPATGTLTRLFNPRVDVWKVHFVYQGVLVEGLTDIGRTTIMVLDINSRANIALRQALVASDLVAFDA